MAVACAALLAALAASAGTKAGAKKTADQKEAGGAMDVTVTMLDAVKPGRVQTAHNDDEERIEPIPFVIWARDDPRAVLAFHWQTLRSRGQLLQEFSAVRGGGQGAFPLRFEAKAPRNLVRNEDLNLIHTSRIVMADVDGDGVEELVLPRDQGGLEVWNPNRKVFNFPTPTKHPDRVIYYANRWIRAALPARDELFLRMARDEFEELEQKQLEHMGAGEKQALLRIGQGGVSRIFLKGLAPGLKNVRAVVPLNRPGSRDVDELVVFSTHEEPADERVHVEMWVSRHRLDGTAIEPSRRMYGGFDLSEDGLEDPVYSPQSDRILATNDKKDRLFFFMPRKETDWMRAVDLSFLVGTGKVQALGMTPDKQSVAIFRYTYESRDEFYAVNEDRQFFVFDTRTLHWVPTGKPVRPGEEWGPGSKPQPFYTVRPPRKEFAARAEVYPAAPGASPDEFVVVHSRERDPRPLTHEELLAAAKRFLSLEELTELEAEVPPTLEGRDDNRDRTMKKERQERGFTGEIKTIEDWKKHLPRSYAEIEADQREDYYTSLEVALLRPLDHPEEPDLVQSRGYREPDAYVAWVRSVERPAATHFTLVQLGRVVASFEVPGYCFLGAPSSYVEQGGLSLRIRNGILDGVAVLSQVPGQEEQRFYHVRAVPRRR
jgi:hypothetical protein